MKIIKLILSAVILFTGFLIFLWFNDEEFGNNKKIAGAAMGVSIGLALSISFS